KLATQTTNDLVGTNFSFCEWLQRDEHSSSVGRRATAAARKRDHIRHCRIALNDVDETHHALLHRRERRVLRALNAARQTSRVLLWKKSLRHDHEQVSVQADGGQQHQQYRQRMAQHPRQTSLIQTQQPREESLTQAIGPSVMLRF